MADDFHKPVLFSAREFEAISGAHDPAVTLRVAHDTAHALVSRVRESSDPSVVKRVVHFTDEHGIDTVAELWAVAGPHTLPGALWRMYLLRAMILSDAETAALLFRRGTEMLTTIDPIVAGAPTPAGPAEVVELADRILRGAFEGDFAHALERAAAFCRVEAAGAASIADDQDASSDERAAHLTKRAARLVTMSDDLGASARLARDGALD